MILSHHNPFIINATDNKNTFINMPPKQIHILSFFFSSFSSCSILVYARNIPSFIPIPISDTHTPLDIAIIVCPNSCIIKLIIKTAILKKTTKPAYCFDKNNGTVICTSIRSDTFVNLLFLKSFSTSKREIPQNFFDFTTHIITHLLFLLTHFPAFCIYKTKY